MEYHAIYKYDSLNFPFLIWISFISFYCLIALAGLDE